MGDRVPFSLFALFLKLVTFPTPCPITSLLVCSISHLSCPTLRDPTDCGPPGSSVHGDFPGKNTGVGCQFLLQGIFPTQGSKLGLLHCRQMLYHWAVREPSLPTARQQEVTTSFVFTLHSMESEQPRVFRGDGRTSRLSSHCLPVVLATCGPHRLFKSMKHWGPTCCLSLSPPVLISSKAIP